MTPVPDAGFVTTLHIGIDASCVASGRAGEPPWTRRIGVGTAATGRGGLRHDPPTPLEMENAIAAIEDEVMPLAGTLARASPLVVSGSAIPDVARCAGKAGDGAIVLELAEVEQLFEQLAAVAEGRPASSSGLPPGTDFAATLLILREFMHHLGFDSVTLGPSPLPSGALQCG